MEILIGRENSSDSRLQLEVGGVKRVYGEKGSVPHTVSRRHCKLIIDADKIVIENISPSNVTYINGREFDRKSISYSDVVELGPERYRLELQRIITFLSKPQTSKPQDLLRLEFSITHLRQVFEDYENAKLQMQVQERRFNAYASATGIFSALSMVVMRAAPELKNLSIAFTVALLICTVFFIYKRFTLAAKNPMLQKQLADKFRENYVCPNPECKRFLGNLPYNELTKVNACPHCKSRFKH